MCGGDLYIVTVTLNVQFSFGDAPLMHLTNEYKFCSLISEVVLHYPCPSQQLQKGFYQLHDVMYSYKIIATCVDFERSIALKASNVLIIDKY